MTKETPDISIITPFYNTGPIFWETFNAVIKQTYTNWEWIIVDDGSNDKEALNILEKAKNLSDKISILHLEKNTGLPGARNHGIKASAAGYIFFIDSDDLIDPIALEKFYLFLENNPNCEFVNSYVVGFGAQDYKWKGGFHEGNIFLHENRTISSFMCRRHVFNAVLFDEKLRDGGEDWDFWLHAASKGYWGYTIPEFLLLYRRNDHGIKWKVLSSEKELQRIGENLREKYGPFLKNFPTREMPGYGFEKVNEVKTNTASPFRSEKNILFIFPWLELGGADKFNLDLATGLKQNGWNMTIVCTKKNEQAWYELFREQTQDIFFLPHYSSESGYYKTLYYLIRTRKPSVIFISNSMYGYYILPFIRQQFPEIPVVDYLHCEDEGWYNGGYPMFSAIFSRLFDKTFVTSWHLKHWCIQRGAVEEKIAVAYINIDTDRVCRNQQVRNRIRNELKVTDDRPVLLYVARLTEQKQPLVLLESIEKLYARTNNFLAVIIGDGPDRPQFLKKLRSSDSRKNIVYLGSQSNEKVKEYMDAADIFFLPTAYEGIAMTIYEAMAKSLAVVAANTGGQSELVIADCGFLIERSDPATESSAYSDKLYDLISDKDQVYELGKEARSRVSRYFQLTEMIRGMDTALQNVIRQHDAAVPSVSYEYVSLLNRLLYQLSVAEHMENQLSNRVNRMMRKYDKEYRFIKKIYYKVKTIGNKK